MRPDLDTEIDTVSVPPYMSFGGDYTNSEENVRHTPPKSLVPEGVRLIAKAMIESAWGDLHENLLQAPKRYWLRPSAAGYRPDPVGARLWFERGDDRPLSFRWCCIALGMDYGAVRKWVFARKARMTRQGVRRVYER